MSPKEEELPTDSVKEDSTKGKLSNAEIIADAGKVYLGKFPCDCRIRQLARLDKRIPRISSRLVAHQIDAATTFQPSSDMATIRRIDTSSDGEDLSSFPPVEPGFWHTWLYCNLEVSLTCLQCFSQTKPNPGEKD